MYFYFAGAKVLLFFDIRKIVMEKCATLCLLFYNSVLDRIWINNVSREFSKYYEIHNEMRNYHVLCELLKDVSKICFKT